MSQGKRLPKDQRRRELLEVARRVFGKKGFRNTEVDEVARAAGVTRPILYRHFPGGKADVFMEVLNGHLEDLMHSVRAAMALSSGPRERLRLGLDAYLEFAESNPEGFLLLVRSSDEVDERVGRRTKEVRDQITSTLSHTIAEVMEGAGLDPGGAPVYAHALLGGVESVGVWWIETQMIDRASLVAYLLAFVWRGFDGLPKDPTRF